VDSNGGYEKSRSHWSAREHDVQRLSIQSDRCAWKGLGECGDPSNSSPTCSVSFGLENETRELEVWFIVGSHMSPSSGPGSPAEAAPELVGEQQDFAFLPLSNPGRPILMLEPGTGKQFAAVACKPTY
jgi:hypothetical protein